MKKITKCIIPAAGFGTRFLPATKAQPKEMLPIVDTPVIQYLVEEAVSAGITDIVIVTGRSKRSIEDHFDTSYELEKVLEEKKKSRELEQIRRVSDMARFYFVRQPLPRGDGDALLRAREIIGDEPCLVLFGDDLIRGETSGAQQLVSAFEQTQTPVIALERVAEEKVSSYGIVEPRESHGTLHTVARFLEKPQPENTTSRLGVIGKYIITPEVFEYLTQDGEAASQDGEIRLADAFARMLSQQKPLHALELEGIRYDTGDKLGFLKATVDYALSRDDIGAEFTEFLRNKLIA